MNPLEWFPFERIPLKRTVTTEAADVWRVEVPGNDELLVLLLVVVVEEGAGEAERSPCVYIVPDNIVYL